MTSDNLTPPPLLLLLLQSQAQFAAISMEERDVWVRVVRSGGVAQRVKSSQLVVGDVLVLETGDR